MPLFAADGDVRHARDLLEQVQTYGTRGITGQAAGQTDARRQARDARDSASASRRRWREIARSLSLD